MYIILHIPEIGGFYRESSLSLYFRSTRQPSIGRLVETTARPSWTLHASNSDETIVQSLSINFAYVRLIFVTQNKLAYNYTKSFFFQFETT